jgi:GAF domain-containing protein
MKKLGFNFISNLVNYLEVNQGAMFVLNDEMEDDCFFELSTAIAYGRDKFMKKEIRLGEGLVGRCAYEKKTIFLTEVPEDYMKITSGLGTANPTCVLIVPCILNDEVYGVIEIASFRTLKPHEIEFVEKLGESLASTISNVIRVKNLLLRKKSFARTWKKWRQPRKI